MKISLQIKRDRDWGNPHFSSQPILKSLPYFRTQSGSYIHRVRYGTIHHYNGQYTHFALKFWCGMTGLGSDKRKQARFYDVPPDGMVVCATCEGRAIGAGLTESRMIAGKIVKFSPRI